MLVLSRKANETIHIGAHVVVKVHRVAGNRVKLGVEAPDDVEILRGELYGKAEGGKGKAENWPHEPPASAGGGPHAA